MPSSPTSRAGPDLVSVHGGHSAEFCSHARDRLEEIIETYVQRGFAWVGITEHVPVVSDELVPPEERAAGLDARDMDERFADYITTCRALQKRFARHIDVFVAFEAETCTGWEAHIGRLVERFRPDYVVGSVHHVGDISIDSSPERYQEAARQQGGLDALYCAYFDEQYEMLRSLRPRVVGHLDLVRLLDPDYAARLMRPEILERIRRNLRTIHELGLILDFNVRALAKGQPEPYVAGPILREAHSLGIPAVPGDDSHGVESVGLHCEEGIRILAELGFDTNWPRPV
jgi:histidinol-phosphatase (PHP family)